jgi:AhpD family alkylhydroperoxidase
LNLDRMLLHSLPLASAWNQFLGTLRSDLAVTRKLQELAICVVAVLNDARYELHHHAPLLRAAGATDSELAAIEHPLDNMSVLQQFEIAERAVIRLTLEMTRMVRVQPQTLAEARAVLRHDQDLVELIAVIAAYNMVSRFLVATGVDIERQEAVGD